MNFAPGLPWVLAAGLALASLAASLHIRRAQFAERLLRIETKQRGAFPFCAQDASIASTAFPEFSLGGRWSTVLK
jgi:hypothetical protein